MRCSKAAITGSPAGQCGYPKPVNLVHAPAVGVPRVHDPRRGPVERECERPACTRLFVDRSRGGTRAWCGMAECGNRVKAADYRARKAAARRPAAAG
jgi:predicted RNA-binding Zn ribbon-like protein